TPFVVEVFAQRLQGIVVTLGEPAIDEPSHGAGRIGRAKIRRLEDSAHYALGCDVMVANVFQISAEHTAPVMRPLSVHRADDDEMPNAPVPQFLVLGREPEERVDLAVDE